MVRMKDIASDLGVSLMTVSKALRNHVDVSSETKRCVLKRAQQLGYQPNWAARSLVAHRTYMVGLVIPDLMHSFFAEVAKAAARRLAPNGYQIIIANSEEDPEAEKREIVGLLARSVDGLIIASAQKSGGWLRRTVGRRRVPCVLIDRRVRGVETCYVGVDDAEVGSLATEHLVEQGCQRIAHIQGPLISTGRGRLLGYRRVLAKHGLKCAPEYVVPGWHQDVTGHAAMQKLLHLSPPPDGVFCYNDPVAAGAVQAVFEAGLRVPDDVAIVGAGNVHYSDLLRVPLSTVDQSSQAIGETAAEQLLKCMENKKPCRAERILIPVRLVVRDSSRLRQCHDSLHEGGTPGPPARNSSRPAGF